MIYIVRENEMINMSQRDLAMCRYWHYDENHDAIDDGQLSLLASRIHHSPESGIEFYHGPKSVCIDLFNRIVAMMKSLENKPHMIIVLDSVIESLENNAQSTNQP